MSQILEYVETCASLTGHEFAIREGLRVVGRDRAYIPVIKTNLDARDSFQACMDRVQQGGLARMFRNSRPI